MKQHDGNIGANFHYLFMKQYISQIKGHNGQLKQLVRNNIPQQIALQIHKYPLENQKGILNHFFSILMEQDWAKKIVRQMSEKLLEKSKDLYEFETQKNYFLVEGFRQTCNQPIVSLKPFECFNFTYLFKISINKQLRRVIWIKSLYIQKNKFQFFKFDHKVMPYNLREQFQIGLIRLSTQNRMKLKQNQKDCCLRLLQYLVKKWDKIPNKSQQYLALNVVDVFAHFTPTKIHEIGSVFVGLIELTDIYFQENIEKRMQYIKLGFQLVDYETYQMIQTCYLPYSQKNNAQLNDCFEHFRLTLSTAFLPLSASQFIIDQLLIKRKNKLDMYIIFAMMAMIMSDDLTKYKQSKMQLTDIINPQNAKKTIKLDDVTDAFRVIYQNIHPFHQKTSQSPQVNKILQNLIKFDEKNEQPKNVEGQQINNAPSSLKLIQDADKMANFVVQQKDQILRLGNQKK